MSPAHVLEPTYEGIRQRLKIGRWPAGTRLEAARLADELGVSITPVRDSLWRLAGEQMVEFLPGDGFRVPRPDANILRDLYELNCVLLLAALSAPPVESVGLAAPGADVADRTATLFSLIGRRSGNEALAACITAINDRLHLIRLNEDALLPDSGKELRAIEEGLASEGAAAACRDVILRYHERRVAIADRIARLAATHSRSNPED